MGRVGPLPEGAEVVAVDGHDLRLEWFDLAACPVDLGHLDRVVGRLVVDAEPRDGRVVCGFDRSGRLLGAAGVDLAHPEGPHAAVGLAPGWRHHGLGAVLARRIITEARSHGSRHLICRCAGSVTDAEETARLFGQDCVSRVRVGFEQVVVLDLRD